MHPLTRCSLNVSIIITASNENVKPNAKCIWNFNGKIDFHRILSFIIFLTLLARARWFWLEPKERQAQLLLPPLDQRNVPQLL